MAVVHGCSPCMAAYITVLNCVCVLPCVADIVTLQRCVCNCNKETLLLLLLLLLLQVQVQVTLYTLQQYSVCDYSKQRHQHALQQEISAAVAATRSDRLRRRLSCVFTIFRSFIFSVQRTTIADAQWQVEQAHALGRLMMSALYGRLLTTLAACRTEEMCVRHRMSARQPQRRQCGLQLWR